MRITIEHALQHLPDDIYPAESNPLDRVSLYTFKVAFMSMAQDVVDFTCFL